MYVRATVYSAAAGGILASRSSSRSASLLRLLGHPGRLDLLAQRVDLLRALVALAELLLDRLELLAQVVLPLRLRHLRLDLRLDLRAELEDLGLLGQRCRRASAAAARRRPSPAAPACRSWASVGQRRGDEVGERARARRRCADHVDQLVRQRRRQRDDLLEQRAHAARPAPPSSRSAAGVGSSIRPRPARAGRARARRPRTMRKRPRPCTMSRRLPSGCLSGLVDDGRPCRPRAGPPAPGASSAADRAASPRRRAGRPGRASSIRRTDDAPPGAQRQHRVRQQHRAAQRQNGQDVGDEPGRGSPSRHSWCSFRFLRTDRRA